MKSKQIFEGVKVADFTWVGVGPQVGRELAEHGATVVHVESHRRPCTLRVGAPYKDGIPGIDRSAFGMAFNTQKYGMSLDLTKPKGLEVARKLIMWADLMGEAFTPGTMKRLGLDYESVREFKPDIIYFSTSQQGQGGPWEKFGGYGSFAAAMGGYSHITGWPDRVPLSIFNNYTDFISPWYLTIAVVLALEHRRRTGEGTYIDQGQVEAGVNFIGPALIDYAVNGRTAGRMGNRDPYMAPHSAYPCSGDDRWVDIAVGSDKEWQAFCKAIGEPDWTHEPKFATFQGRKENEDELDCLVAEWTKDYLDREVMLQMQSHGVAAGVAQTSPDLFQDPQLKHRQHFRVLNHTVIGSHAYNAPAYILSKTPNDIHRAAPCLGEHNDFVYKEILGYSDEEVTQFLLDNVITTEHDVPDILRKK